VSLGNAAEPKFREAIITVLHDLPPVRFLNRSKIKVKLPKLLQSLELQHSLVSDLGSVVAERERTQSRTEPDTLDSLEVTPLKVKAMIMGLNESQADKGMQSFQSSFAGGALTAQLASLSGLNLTVFGLKISTGNFGPVDPRVDPFHRKLDASNQNFTSLPFMPNITAFVPGTPTSEVNRDPGVTEINIQGHYDSATGAWHKDKPSRLGEVDDSHSVKQIATDLETGSQPSEESDSAVESAVEMLDIGGDTQPLVYDEGSYSLDDRPVDMARAIESDLHVLNIDRRQDWLRAIDVDS
jgi:hypothetical protein